MKAVFRVDASTQMGIGHLMRCLTLAEALRERGVQTRFICREHTGKLIALLQQKAMLVTVLPAPAVNDTTASDEDYAAWLGVTQAEDAEQTIEALNGEKPDWLVVDHYGLDVEWEQRLRPHVCKLMVIDDLANRSHECDLLLDQNYYRNLERRYQGLVPNTCECLLGPSYVLLRQEFTDARSHLRVRDGIVRRILVFFGGSDPTNQTRKALDAISLLSRPEIEVDVVVGASNPHRDEIKTVCKQMPNVQYHCQVGNMAELISASDMAIGAGGATTWERCMLGLPTLTAVIAENQLQTTMDLDEFGAIVFLGWADKLTVADLVHAIHRVLERPALLCKLSERASHLMKGYLGVEFVAKAMTNLMNADQRSKG